MRLYVQNQHNAPIPPTVRFEPAAAAGQQAFSVRLTLRGIYYACQKMPAGAREEAWFYLEPWYMSHDDAEVARLVAAGRLDPDHRARRALENTRAAPSRQVTEGLRPFQVKGVDWLLSKQRAILADEQGLGKTVQVARALESDPSIDPVLVVCPAHLTLQWQRELSRWAPSKDSVVVGPDTKITKPSGVVICSYNRLVTIDQWIDSPDFSGLVLDEAHYIKNLSAKRTKAAHGLRTDICWMLTGTPLLNRPDELFSLLKKAEHRLGHSFQSFEKRYICYNSFGRVIGVYPSRLEELKSLISQVMLRRTKAEVLPELPEKNRIHIVTDVAGIEQEKRLLSSAPDAELILTQGSGYSRRLFLWLQEMATIRRQTAVAKVPVVCEYVRDLLESGTEKVVLWWHHREAVEHAAAMLDDYGTVIIWGGQTPSQRHQAVVSFTEGDARVAVASITAANVGLNLQVADTAVFGELDWVPANLYQAEDRIHRIGQQSSVTIYYVTAEGSFDEFIAERLVSKQLMIAQILS